MSHQSAVPGFFDSHLRRLFAVLFCAALLLSTLSAQQNVAVPQLVKFGGTISGAPAGTVSVIFALYKDQTGGAPLWQEVQNLTLNADGHYSTLLGATSATGVPVDLFSSNEARWLGVQPEGQVEQSRVLLVSVPYALKASDAETLGGLPASAFLRADPVSSTTAPTAAAAYVNTAAVSADAAAIAAKPALTASGASANYFPVFTDVSGDVTDSALYQLVIPATATTPTITNLGFGTTTPAFNLNFVSQVDPAAIAIDGYGTVGINFIGRRAEGTLAKPSAILLNDNIMAMQGRGYGATGFSTTSRAYMKFFAAENWTDAAQGTYINFATTPTGSAIAVERLRITAPGFIGIGTTTPAYPLSVAGAIQSTTGGFVFPDGSTQTKAASAGPTGPAGPAGPTGATGPAGPIGPQGPAGTGAAVVKDAHGNVLGTLVSMGGLNGTDVTIYTNGYFVTVGITGQFPAGSVILDFDGVDWSGAGCTGTPYVGAYVPSGALQFTTNFPTTYAKNVAYSAQANTLLVPASTTAVNYSASSSEYAGYGPPDDTYADGISDCEANSPALSGSGWPMAVLSPATLGWTATGNPLSVAGPLVLP